jgi:hypothetical protein
MTLVLQLLVVLLDLLESWKMTIPSPVAQKQARRPPKSRSTPAKGSTLAKDSGAAARAAPLAERKPARANLDVCPNREYLDTVIADVMLRSMAALARKRPPNPLMFMSEFFRTEHANIEKGGDDDDDADNDNDK